MRRIIIIALLTVLLLLVGCKSSEVAVKPEPIDLEPSMKVIFDTKPKNERLDIILEIQTVEDIVHNSGQYYKAWQSWEIYALGLEDYILKINETLKGNAE